MLIELNEKENLKGSLVGKHHPVQKLINSIVRKKQSQMTHNTSTQLSITLRYIHAKKVK